MNLIRLCGAAAVLLSISLFIQVNTSSLDGGSGYLFLLIALAGTGAVIFGNGDLLHLPVIRFSTVLLIVFSGYYFVKYYFESGDYEQTKQISIGTTGGIVFALILGFMVSMALLALYDSAARSRLISRLVFLFGLGYVALVVLLTLSTMQVHLAGVRSDLLLIEEQTGKYQRAGDLFSIQMLIVVSLGVMLIARAKSLRLVVFLPLTLLVLSLGAIIGFTSQVIGSNKGLVVTIALALLYLVMLFLSGSSRRRPAGASISQLLRVGQLSKMVFASVLAALVLGGFGVFMLQRFGIDTEMLRITGFGSGEMSSTESRAEIFQQHFVEHFSYAPLFGHTQVEKILTGEGLFVHSLLSILTHLGIFGFLIFLWLLVSVYRDIVVTTYGRDGSLLGDPFYGIFRLLALGLVIAMCSFAAFFTWMPLWVAFGLCGNWFRSGVGIRSSAPHRHRRSERHRSAAMEV